jgi:hypothetical protein
MVVSRSIGALFLAGFLVYGVGSALTTSVVGHDDFLPALGAHRTTLVLGAFLMMLNTPVDIAKGVLFYPVLERHGRRSALAYLVLISAEAVVLSLGVLCLLMTIPLHHRGVEPVFGALAVDGNAAAYQFGEVLLGMGGVFLCARLLLGGLIPRWAAWWGALGYVILFIGNGADLAGAHIGTVLSIPGGLFEVFLGVWLIVKGLRPVPPVA